MDADGMTLGGGFSALANAEDFFADDVHGGPRLPLGAELTMALEPMATDAEPGSAAGGGGGTPAAPPGAPRRGASPSPASDGRGAARRAPRRKRMLLDKVTQIPADEMKAMTKDDAMQDIVLSDADLVRARARKKPRRHAPFDLRRDLAELPLLSMVGGDDPALLAAAMEEMSGPPAMVREMQREAPREVARAADDDERADGGAGLGFEDSFMPPVAGEVSAAPSTRPPSVGTFGSELPGLPADPLARRSSTGLRPLSFGGADDGLRDEFELGDALGATDFSLARGGERRDLSANYSVRGWRRRHTDHSLHSPVSPGGLAPVASPVAGAVGAADAHHGAPAARRQGGRLLRRRVRRHRAGRRPRRAIHPKDRLAAAPRTHRAPAHRSRAPRPRLHRPAS